VHTLFYTAELISEEKVSIHNLKIHYDFLTSCDYIQSQNGLQFSKMNFESVHELTEIG
jgi:hypothetical protein